MKVVIQRVFKASVIVKETNKEVGKIDQGLFILLGIKKGDSQKQVGELVSKLIKLRIMSDQNSKMNLSIVDTKSEILLVSQFTLYANTKDGNRPSFIDAEEPAKAKELYEYMITKLKETGLNVQTGSFGDYMEINAVLDGPVTIVLEN
ncbi:D-tyrosyl-tRNA(Tyr) deacylase [Candidatus Woesebacteria bacterium GWC2_33_12]|uniref:D-aminoacyl-tRNA deacylase n=1 Tax=Candidatus Woesebacteria bacterium GW2011_GWB1_33_22 TaxID=1618566 RepID=A0A0G0A111_9BACT|nr:MAG: D-tyrosyl-tRNA(Tyr) deacylase [Candidatus Woesebacteria bacterium GW2011_GWC2_33_12]KKP42147.1 MAG: D-tyrosyl-tRNA(Tyr) deacylase [Candidatus Woesebacteria bacterium GW2011_GWA2_33_20]KKP44881.1 MAG: D-tyrosyl-tRNA(Tyr) deacylase [Candidatus Woesebacteria bacterium GW2011_GWB1_33_22]KKP46695.1 MAG: D-tyrosyl-tRNA(Tyr) deacylase [Microgenomates group bacterium GW2011_GWC1_33_28]KKP50595.1 MAG: D-tyrosyl-tRNA(Tyr) deacylase [Candidatus Woesebacteria bacterium GW2011_GWA1_33_33]OGM07740.1